MPKFVTIGYGDRTGYERTAPQVRDAAHAHDATLKQRGVLMGIAGTPVQVRNPKGCCRREDQNWPLRHPPLPVAGFAIIEAADLAEAIELARIHHARWPMACRGLAASGRSFSYPTAVIAREAMTAGVRPLDREPPARMLRLRSRSMRAGGSRSNAPAPALGLLCSAALVQMHRHRRKHRNPHKSGPDQPEPGRDPDQRRDAGDDGRRRDHDGELERG